MKEKRGAEAVGCCLHGGQGVQGGEGSRGDAGDLVVVQRQQAHGAQARERTVVDAGDLVAPQHSAKKQTQRPKNINVWQIKSFGLTLKLLVLEPAAKRGALFRQRKGSQDKRARPVTTQIKDKSELGGGKFKPGPHRTTVTDPAI